MAIEIGRRQFISALGVGVGVARPLAARAQQPAMPVIGYLAIGPAALNELRMASFRNGLSEQGFVEGRNAVIESRYAPTGNYNDLLALATDLVRLPVAVLFATGSAGVARAARAATATIPIVFANGGDPVKVGLVASLNRPGGNATGMSFYTSALVPKRLELVRELVPHLPLIAFLVNPSNPVAEGDTEEMEEAARSIGQPIIVVKASNESEIDAAFATIARERAGAVLVDVDAYFSSRRDQLAALAARYRIPASYNNRDYVVAGGLMSYGPDLNEAVRQAGIYVGRILKGEKPADLPVMQPTKFELVINLKTAKALGIAIPPTLLALADEAIE
jgi:putative tryptophan/tyrosine transport system substrate-binding protein